jgi:hypothetical protein
MNSAPSHSKHFLLCLHLVLISVPHQPRLLRVLQLRVVDLKKSLIMTKLERGTFTSFPLPPRHKLFTPTKSNLYSRALQFSQPRLPAPSAQCPRRLLLQNLADLGRGSLAVQARRRLQGPVQQLPTLWTPCLRVSTRLKSAKMNRVSISKPI